MQNCEMNCGNVLILCGKSGSGKDSILKRLVAEYEYAPIVSYTTRPMRDGEVDGREYNFVTNEDFWEMIKNDELIEYRKYNTLVGGEPATWYYGLRKQDLMPDESYVVVLDMDGARSFIEYYGEDNCFPCYIEASEDIRKSRARIRGSFDETEWDRRVAADNSDFSKAIVDASVRAAVRNDGELEDCVKEVHARFYLFNELFCQ